MIQKFMMIIIAKGDDDADVDDNANNGDGVKCFTTTSTSTSMNTRTSYPTPNGRFRFLFYQQYRVSSLTPFDRTFESPKVNSRESTAYSLKTDHHEAQIRLLCSKTLSFSLSLSRSLSLSHSLNSDLFLAIARPRLVPDILCSTWKSIPEQDPGLSFLYSGQRSSNEAHVHRRTRFTNSRSHPRLIRESEQVTQTPTVFSHRAAPELCYEHFPHVSGESTTSLRELLARPPARPPAVRASERIGEIFERLPYRRRKMQS